MAEADIVELGASHVPASLSKTLEGVRLEGQKTINSNAEISTPMPQCTNDTVCRPACTFSF